MNKKKPTYKSLISLIGMAIYMSMPYLIFGLYCGYLWNEFDNWFNWCVLSMTFLGIVGLALCVIFNENKE